MWEPGGLREAGLPAALSAASPAKALPAESLRPLPAESLRPLPAAPPAQGRVQGKIVRELEVNTDLSRLRCTQKPSPGSEAAGSGCAKPCPWAEGGAARSAVTDEVVLLGGSA